MNKAYTYTPAVNGDGSYDVSNGTLTSGRGGGQVDAVFEENEVTGERQYLITQQDEQTDLDYQKSNEEDYLLAIHELYPNIQEMLAFGKNFYPPEHIISFNEAINGDDDAEMWRYLEQLDQDYKENNPDYSSVEQVEEVVAQEQIDNAVDGLMSMEAEGNEVAYAWMEQAVEIQDSNPIYSAIAAQTARFHRGEIDASQAISEMLERYTPAQLAPYYQQLTNAS